MTTEDHFKLDKLNSLSGPYKAFLYDCDGTLADNMPAHKETYLRIAEGEGWKIDGGIVDELAGWPTIKVVEEINRRYGSGFNPVEFNDQKYKLFLEEYIDQTKPIDFVVEHLRGHAGKVKIGVVSGGSREAVERTLQVLGISDLIDVSVCAGETVFGKPFPDPFLTAASYLNVSPRDCLVLEDGLAGINAAKAAGMNWVRIDQL